MNLPLIEKYRPKDFDGVVGVKDLEKLKSLISKPSEMPNLLFHGPAGTGKTTVAKIIINKLKPVDVMKINGSDTTGVDTIREKVYNFITSMSSVKDMPKIVWIEEFDYMSANAFAALRSMMEQYMSNARFICTCNYVNKIPDPIQSRFTSVEFEKIASEIMAEKIANICIQEKITASSDVINTIVETGNGDLRSVLNNVQRLSANDNKTISVMAITAGKELQDEVYNLLIARQWSKIRYEIPSKNPDYNSLLVELENKFFHSDLSINVKAAVTELIAQGLYEMASSFDQNICFAAVCSKIIKVLP